MFRECEHKEAVKEVVKTLTNYGYLVSVEAWICTSLASLDKFKFNVANIFLKSVSPWRYLHNPNFQTRLDVVGLYYKDLEGLDPYTFFTKRGAEEIALRTILVEVERRHSLDEAILRIRDFPAGRKVIVWTRGEFGGIIEGIFVLPARDDGYGCYIPNFVSLISEHIREIEEGHSLYD